MSANNNICILKLGSDETIWLVSEKAFKSASEVMFSTRKLRSYLGGEVICHDCVVRVITSIEKKHLAGDSLLERIMSAFTGTYDIQVAFEDRGQLSVSEIRDSLIKSLMDNRQSYRDGHFFLVDEDRDASIEKICTSLVNAKKFDDILASFGYSEDEGGYLDGL